MRKLTKALAAVLLLAVIVSVMAVLPSFTVSAAGGEEEIETLYNMNALNSISFQSSSLQTNAAGQKVPQVGAYKTAGNGAKYFTIDMLDTKTGEVLGTNKMFYAMNFKNKVYIQDDAGYPSGDSNSKRNASSKNTDYFVADFDFDISANCIDKIYFNTRAYPSGSGTASAGNVVEFGRDAETGKFFVGNSDGTNKLYPTYQPEGDWLNVTIIYDFSSFESSPASRCYVYFDGIYAGTIKTFTSTNAYIAWIRLTLDHTAATTDNQATNIANFTLKRFPANYSGPLTNVTTLGGNGVYLGDLADMAYCFENVPGDEGESFTYNGAIASIKRGEADPVLVKDYYDLTGDLEDGDIVTVYGNIQKPIVIKEGQNITWKDRNGVPLSDDAAIVDMPTIVTAKADSDWIVIDPSTGAILSSGTAQGKASDITASRTDLNGDGEYTVLYQEENGKYHLEDAVEKITIYRTKEGAIEVTKITTETDSNTDLNADEAYTILYQDENGNYYLEEQVESVSAYQTIEGAIRVTKITTETVWNVVDPLFTAATSASAYVCLFGDVAMEGSECTLESSKNIVFDLNNNALTVVARKGHVFTYHKNGAAPITRFMNGTLNFAGYAGNIVMANNCTGAQMFFQDLTLNIDDTYVFMDVRDGRHVFYNCDITTEQDFLLRSMDENAAAMEFHGCSITRNVAEGEKAANRQLFTVGNVRGLYGSSKNQLILDGCNIVISSESGNAIMLKTNPVYRSGSTNNNYADIRILNTNVDMSGVKGTSTFIYNIPGGTSPTESTSFNTDITIEGSDFVGDTFYYTSVTNGSNYEYSLVSNVSISDSKIGTSVLTSYNTSARYATINLDIADGVMLGTNKLTTSTDYAPVVTYESENSKIAYTSLGAEAACDYIVSSDYRTCSYTLGAQQPETFYWNAQSNEADAIDMDKVVTLENKEGAYRYEWTNDGNDYTAVLKRAFAFSAKTTMTLEDNFNYNLYIPAELYAQLSALECVTIEVNGEALSTAELVTKGDKQYYVTRVGVAPTASDAKTIALDVIVTGAYGDEVTVIDAEFSVLDYINDILVKNADKQADVDLMYAILNYISAACEYTNTNAALKTVVDDKLEAAGIAAPGEIQGEGKYAAPAGTTGASVYFGATNGWSIKLAEGVESITVTYGNVTKEYVAEGSGIVNVEVPMQYFVEGIDVNGTVINLKGYYDNLTDANAQAMARAIANYSYAAAAYVASVSGN